MSGLRPFRNIPRNLVEWTRWMRDQDGSLSSFINQTISESTLCGEGANSTVTGDGGCDWDFVYFDGDYTLDSSDAGKFLVSTSAAAVNLTIPSGVFEVGEQVSIYQYGAGQVTVVAGTGATINTPSTLKIAEQYGTIALVLEDNDDWFLAGRTETGDSSVVSLADLSDVGSASPANRFALIGNGTNFSTRALLEADISDLQSYLLASDDVVATGSWEFQQDVLYGLSDSLKWKSDIGVEFDMVTAVSVATANTDDNTLLQIRFNGPGNNLTTADDDTGNHTAGITFSGNAKIYDSPAPKEGNRALDLDGTDDYVSVASHADFDFGTDDFTVEAWFLAQSLPNQNLISWGASNQGGIYSNTDDTTVKYQTGGVERMTGGNLVVDDWVHIALVRESGLDRLYVDGVQVATDSTGQSFGQGSIEIGRRIGNDSDFHGHIDCVRVSSIARYTGGATFTTPPTTFDTKTQMQIGHDDYELVLKGSSVLLPTAVVTKAANYTLTSSDNVVLVNGTYTMTLPTAVGIEGTIYTIKNIGTGTATVDGDGTETIDSNTTVDLAPEEALKIVSDGTEWWII